MSRGKKKQEPDYVTEYVLYDLDSNGNVGDELGEYDTPTGAEVTLRNDDVGLADGTYIVVERHQIKKLTKKSDTTVKVTVNVENT